MPGRVVRIEQVFDWTVAEEPREKHIAYSARVGEFGERPLIVLRALKSWERTRWSVAHEIGHIVLHADGVDSDDQEEQANRFASELLAPAKALVDEVPASAVVAESVAAQV
jgi:Zn-dependent peptidase ImmA (M78 family)